MSQIHYNSSDSSFFIYREKAHANKELDRENSKPRRESQITPR